MPQERRIDFHIPQAIRLKTANSFEGTFSLKLKDKSWSVRMPKRDHVQMHNPISRSGLAQPSLKPTENIDVHEEDRPVHPDIFGNHTSPTLESHSQICVSDYTDNDPPILPRIPLAQPVRVMRSKYSEKVTFPAIAYLKGVTASRPHSPAQPPPRPPPLWIVSVHSRTVFFCYVPLPAYNWTTQLR